MRSLLKILPVIIIFGFTQTANMPTGNWYQQFLPSPSGGTLKDIYFIDSLLGFAVTDSCILKTTNRGDNWSINLQGFYIFQRIKFLNSQTGFACAGNNRLLKTTNTGGNWTETTPGGIFPSDMSVLNQDTIWLVDPEGLSGGVFRTTNGGTNWTLQFSMFNNNPDKIYMFNRNLGFISHLDASLYRTTNSGVNWMPISGTDGFRDMKFVDTLTGWKSRGSMKKTTNGGTNWVQQILPSGGQISSGSGIGKFSIINNSDTIWGVGGVFYLGPGSSNPRGFLYRTTNGGNNWLFQVPDTNIQIITEYSYVQFINGKVGWAYSLGLGGIHTTNGGDTAWLTAIRPISSEVPDEFMLFQNYPNPFNPRTNIKYQISKRSNIKLTVFDITGREITTLVNQRQNPGTYEVDFSGAGLSSGVYFYRLFVDDNIIDTKKMVLVK